MSHRFHRFENVPVLDRLSDDELERLDSLTTTVSLSAGEVVMTEGAFGNEALILLEGALAVERDGEFVALLSPGAVVGEQALILNEPRNATVTAATDVVVAAMSRREFSTMLEACPSFARTVLTEAMDRVSATA